MSLFKYTFFGDDSRENGWSQSLFRDEPGVTILSEPVRAKALVKKIVKLLGIDVKYTYIRQSRDDIKGDGLLTQLDLITNADFKGDGSKPIEQAGSCLLVQMSNADRTKKKAFYLHGVWDTAITGAIYADPIGYAAAFTAFGNELKNYGWGWKTVDSKVQSNIDKVEATPGDKLKITTVDPVFVGPFKGQHQQVYVTGIESFPHIHNPLVVVPTDVNVCFTFRKFIKPFADGATITRNVYAFIKPFNVEIVRPCTRRVGRPFRPQGGGHKSRRQ